METMETTKKTYVEPTAHNVNETIKIIEKYAEANGYRIIGTPPKMKEKLLQFGAYTLNFDSKKKQKVLRNYLTSIHSKVGMSNANRFFHFLWKKILKEQSPAPRIEYSEKELKIKELKKDWKRAMAEAERLLAEYKKEKGDFYKK